MIYTTLLMVSLFTSLSYGENWPTWRGMHNNGLASSDAAPPLTWSESKHIKWKVKLEGKGNSTPIVWGNKLFYQTSINTVSKDHNSTAGQNEKSSPPENRRRGKGDRKKGNGERKGRRGGSKHERPAPTDIHHFDIVCKNLDTGKTVWQKTVNAVVPISGHHKDNTYASYSPVTDGKHVWCNFGSYGIHCYDINGNHVWTKDLGTMKTRNSFGEGSSPALKDNILIIVMDQEAQSKIVALNKTTGEIVWEHQRDELTNWTTPVIIEVDKKQQVIVNGGKQTMAYDLETGKTIWTCSGQTNNVVPTPVVGFGNVYCTSGFRGTALFAIALGKKGNLSDTRAVKWSVRDGKTTPYVPSPVLYKEQLYVLSSNTGKVSCYNAQTGREHYIKKNLGIFGIYASPVGANKRIYFVGREGKTTVIKNDTKFEIVATNILDDAFNASPVVVGNQLLLKGEEHLYCIAE